MFTQNYINLQKAAFTGVTHSVKVVNGDDKPLPMTTNTNALRYSGLGYWLNVGRCCEIKNSAGSMATGGLSKDDSVGIGGVWFGTSPTPATKDDYTLGGAITSGLTVTSPAAVTQKDEGGGKYTFLSDFIIRNDTESDINICEIGLFTAPINGNTAYNVLMERTVLTEPITIPAGESRLVTYKLTFNQTLSVD